MAQYIVSVISRPKFYNNCQNQESRKIQIVSSIDLVAEKISAFSNG